MDKKARVVCGVGLMSLGDFIAALQSVELPVVGMLTPELALFALSVAFFGFGTAICAMAVKASNGARDAREDARLMMRTVQDYAVEVRQLAARAEKADLSGHASNNGAPQEGLSERIQGVRVGARNDTEEASLTVEEADDGVLADEAELEAIVEDEDANARLADATRAATEPRSLLSGMLRRR